MGTYEKPGQIKVADASVIGKGVQAGMKSIYTAMMANAKERKKRNLKIIGKNNEDYAKYDKASFDVKNVGMQGFDDKVRNMLESGGNDYYELANKVNRGEISYADGKASMNRILAMPENSKNLNASLKAFYDDMDAAMQLQPGQPGYVAAREMDDRLTAIYYDFKNNQGANIGMNYDETGNIFLTLKGEDGEDDIVLNGGMFSKESYGGIEMVQKMPDLNEMINPLVDELKKSIGYDKGVSESVKGETSSRTYKNYTGRNASLLQNVEKPNTFSSVLENTDFKNGFGFLVDKYGGELSEDLLTSNGINLGDKWFAGTDQAYEEKDGKMVETEESKAQKKLANELLIKWTMDPANGQIQEDPGRVLTAKSSFPGSKNKDGSKSTQKEREADYWSKSIDKIEKEGDKFTPDGVTNWLNTNTIASGDDKTSYITKKTLLEHYEKKYPKPAKRGYDLYKSTREEYIEKIKSMRDDQIFRVDEGDKDAAINNRVYSASGNVKDELLEEIGKINTSGSGGDEETGGNIR